MSEHPTAGSAQTSSLPDSFAAWRHDVRTHLNHILGYCELLQEEMPESCAQQTGRVLAHLIAAAGRIVQRLSSAITAAGNPGSGAAGAELETEILAFAQNVEAAAASVETALQASSAESPRTDLDRVRKAGRGLAGLAGAFRSVLKDNAETAAAPLERAAVHSTDFASTTDSPANGLRALVADDNEGNRDILSRFLGRDGYHVVAVRDGASAIQEVRAHPYDIVLLDLKMADMDGLAVLQCLKSDANLNRMPVVMLSAVDEIESVVACIEAGAEDYVTKPFNSVLLRARLKVLLERKRLEEQERRRTQELEAALAEVEKQKKSNEELLANILPQSVARELQAHGSAAPQYFADVTIVFTDFAGFTRSTEHLPAEELVDVLNRYFTAFDRIIDRYGLEKLKTIGDSYMFVGGMPEPSPSHPVDAVLAALEIVQTVREIEGGPVDWKIRVGIHTGPVIAGIVGIRKFAFDVWGESVNVAARMESSSEPNRVNISERTYARVKDFFACDPRGRVPTKDGFELDMYFVNGPSPKLMEEAGACPPALFARRYQIYFRKPLRIFPAYLLP